MVCLIISDSHSSHFNIRRALSRTPDAEVVFYLGDGIENIEQYIDSDPCRAWIFVRGNCDGPCVIKNGFVGKVERITLFGRKIVLTHGDLYGAKYGTGGLLALARDEHADIVLYGHTHIPKEEYDPESGVYLFNPGSLEASWGQKPSFGTLTLSDSGEILFSHGTL